MNPRTLSILVVLGVIAVAGGWYFGTATKPAQQIAVQSGQLMFPDLASKLRDAAKIEIESQGRTLVIDRASGQWGLPDRGGYPVQDTKLRGMLTALTELRLVEPRTSDPEQYIRLGVADPGARESKSNLLRVLDTGGKPIISVVVGHRRVRTQAKVPEQVYVRLPGQAQAWLAEGALQVDSDPQLWLDRDIMNIDHNRIASVIVARGDANLAFARNDGKFILTSPADHPKLEEYRLEDVARGLEHLTFQDVRPASDPVGNAPVGNAPAGDAPAGDARVGDARVGDAIGQSVFTTADGLSVTATVFRGEKDIWARFSAAAAEEKAKPEADRLAPRLAGWTYQLGSWKEKALVPTLDDLKATEPAAEPTAAGGADAQPEQPTPAAGLDATQPAAGGPSAPPAPETPKQ